jgi:hypothetical protein
MEFKITLQNWHEYVTDRENVFVVFGNGCFILQDYKTSNQTEQYSVPARNFAVSDSGVYLYIEFL